MNLSPEQQAVVESWGQGIAVMAGAGSGKTTTLVLKCIALLRRKPDARFAAVSFTERSASDLRAKLSEKLSKAGIPGKREGGPLAGHWVMTIHGLCSAIIREFPREAGFDGGEGMLSESESSLLWERAIESLWGDTLADPIREALDELLTLESRDSVSGLLARMRELAAFGARERLAATEDSRSRRLATLSGYVLDRYQRLKQRGGSLDFNDLELGAERALRSAAVRENFRARFELVLVDEFQDTNPVQARIIRAFCRADLSNLCVVGDPKQSIYRFRDADVSLFEEFCRELPENHSLTWNFRSRPGIIEYANEICAPAFAESGMVYEALVPKREPSEDFEPVLRINVRDPDELARWVASEARRGVPLADMALLMRRIRGNEKWLKAFSAAGVPIAVGSGGLFWGDPRVRELVAFLRWWDDPANTLSGAVFLRAPWVGIRDLDLDQWSRQDPTFVAPFFASGHGLAQALAPFRGQTCRPSELLLALLATPEIEDELGVSLLGLWHRAEEFSSRGMGFGAVVEEFSSSRDESRRERDVPPPRNQGSLAVLTLHSSKGLEFRHVILLDFGGKRRAPNAPMLFWDRARGAFLGVRDEAGERDKDHPEESVWRAEENRKALAESKRLFYVALTRAQERLVLVCPELPPAVEKAPPQRVPKKPAEPKPEESPYFRDDWRAWLEAGPAPTRVIEAGEAPVENLDAASAPPKPEVLRLVLPAARVRRPRHSVTEWNLLSRCPRSYEWTYVRPVAVYEAIPEVPARVVEQLGLFTGARVETVADTEVTQQELGSRVHACLERGDYDGLRELEKEVGTERFAAAPVTSWALSSEWMAPPSAAIGREVWPELAFEVRIGDEVLVGSMDRVVLDANAPTRGVEPGPRIALIDFKVTAKAKSVEALVEAYRTQIELYAYALRALVAGSLYSTATVETLLVNIAPGAIQTVPVAVKGELPALENLAGLAGEIIAGQPGRPTPGPLCRVCEFRPRCPEGQSAV